MWHFFLNFFSHLKNMNSLQNSFWAVQDHFWAQNYFECFKRTNATTEIFFLIFGHFDWFPPTLEKKKSNFGILPKISSNFEISDVGIWPNIWPIGQKFRPKTFVSPIFLPKKFWAKSDHYQRIKCKKTNPPPPSKRVWRGVGFYWSLIPVTI